MEYSAQNNDMPCLTEFVMTMAVSLGDWAFVVDVQYNVMQPSILHNLLIISRYASV